MPNNTAAKGHMVSVKLPVEIHKQLKDIAEDEERTVGQVVRRIIKAHLSNQAPPEDVPPAA